MDKRLLKLLETSDTPTLRALITEVYEPRQEWAEEEIKNLKSRVNELESAIQNRQVQLKLVVENNVLE